MHTLLKVILVIFLLYFIICIIFLFTNKSLPQQSSQQKLLETFRLIPRQTPEEASLEALQIATF
jgi:hypothetical protein